MSFDTEPGTQLAAIRQNIQSCRLTTNAEKGACTALVDAALAGTPDADASFLHIDGLQHSLRREAKAQGWYLRGATESIDSGEAISTRREDHLLAGLQFALKSADPALDPADLASIAQNLYVELSTPGSHSAALSAYGHLSLHQHGTPMWIADLEGQPLPNLSALPARLGLKPDPTLGMQYVLMQLNLHEGQLPRFADSAGYPYWKPGGRTAPTEGAGGALGVKEVVADRLSLRQLRTELVAFQRAH